MRLLAMTVVATLVVACERANHVQILLGADEDHLSIGFRCQRDGRLLLADAAYADGVATVNIVIDFIDLGDRAIGCRGEDFRRTCTEEPQGSTVCTVTPELNPRRYCRALRVPIMTPLEDHEAELVTSFIQAFAALDPVTTDAPDEIVVVRAVVTNQSCDEIVQVVGEQYASFDRDQVLGCAYSCPFQLDAVDGRVSLSLDTYTTSCQDAVQTCATLDFTSFDVSR